MCLPSLPGRHTPYHVGTICNGLLSVESTLYELCVHVMWSVCIVCTCVCVCVCVCMIWGGGGGGGEGRGEWKQK